MEIGTTKNAISLKSKIITGLFFGFITTLGVALLDFALGDPKDIIRYVFGFAFTSIFFGIFFPYVMSKNAGISSGQLQNKMKPTLDPNEIIKVSGPAILFKDSDAYNGEIFLTNEKFIFTSANLGNQSILDYNSINNITSKESWANAGSKLKITTNDNTHYNFLVNDPTDWINNINKLRKSN